jgi:hypothetical protein
MAEFFIKSDGTAFEPALGRATELIESQAYQKADIMFVTDGQAPVASKFLVKFLETKKEFRNSGYSAFRSRQIIYLHWRSSSEYNCRVRIRELSMAA